MERTELDGQDRGQLGLTESQENYLKQIFMLGEDGANVSTQALAERLRVRPASVTGMIHRLVELGLVEHERYRGVRLTQEGRQAALEILRHHRLLETYLARKLGYRWDEVHEEAERLEHVISDLFEARRARKTGTASTCWDAWAWFREFGCLSRRSRIWRRGSRWPVSATCCPARWPPSCG
jgi:Mn-dependent DtxR family transcriptional regulator